MITQATIDRLYISIHAPTWGATLDGRVWDQYPEVFQSTLPHGERRSACSRACQISDFNPRSHMGSDRILFTVLWISWIQFQSTLPHGERLADKYSFAAPLRFQSTLPHGERLPSRIEVQKVGDFNPRSHMGSDTVRFILISPIPFQSTLPHGERRLSGRNPHFPSQFQSTLPHGERLIKEQRMKKQKDISIHAPTWGATSRSDAELTAELFQSTLPHGERHLRRLACVLHFYFNPRSHMGSDLTNASAPVIQVHFNPRSHMGSDMESKGRVGLRYDFNPRSHMGSDNSSPYGLKNQSYFNPRSHMGSDAMTWALFGKARKFQSTLPHGERLLLSQGV